MSQKLLDVFQRILASRKTVLAGVTLLVDVGAVWGFDVPADQLTSGIGAVWNGLGALLIAAQGVIDSVQGSPSDGTAKS